MLNKKNLTLAVSLLAALALFAGCANAAAMGSPATLPTTAPAETRPAETAPVLLDLGQVKDIAYAHAGVDEQKATDQSYDFDDGCYEIEFDHGGWEYDYRIAPDGTILFSEKKPEPTRPAEQKPAEQKPAETKPAETKPVETKPAETQPKAERISREKALSIAQSHAGVTDAYDKEAEWDDGRWEVSFDSGRTEYEYKLSADGTILRWEKENDD